jgi:hypothetical protein
MLREMKCRESIKALPLIYLQECLDYDRETGTFTWKWRPLHHFKDQRTQNNINSRQAGKPAGGLCAGYMRLAVVKDGVSYRLSVHDLVWKFEGRELPDDMELDHKDKNKLNNVITNLRLATARQNAWNKPKSKTNTSGVTGVWYDDKHGTPKWVAEIKFEEKKKHLGRFLTLEEAAAVRRAAELKYFGEFGPNYDADESMPDMPSGLTPEEELWVNSIGSL